MSMLAKQLRTSREKDLFVLSALFAAVFWFFLLLSMVGLLWFLLIGLGALVAHCLLIAHVTGNGVRIGPRQLPDLHARIEAAARKLGLTETPEAYVVQSGGLLNAFATKILKRRFIILYSDLIEACERDGAAPNELDFVIGHELGHLAAGHLAYRLFLLPARLLPLIGPAYSRACEYTCDRCGHAVVGDLAVSSRALCVLAAGPRTARRMDVDAFVEQRAEGRRFWMAVYELNASHPFLSKRVAALRNWQRQGSAVPLGRNPFAYPLAPFFGFASSGAAGAVVIVIVVFALTTSALLGPLKQDLPALFGQLSGQPAGLQMHGAEEELAAAEAAAAAAATGANAESAESPAAGANGESPESAESPESLAAPEKDETPAKPKRAKSRRRAR